jgi:hypothetical protein
MRPTPIRATGGFYKLLCGFRRRHSADTHLSPRFFYADERKADGSNVGQGIDGEAHADFFAQLAAGPKDVPWHATFVKGQGYTKF